MARLTGPDAAERLCYTLRADNAIGTAAGLPAVVYADAGGTQLANILTTGGTAITGSALTVDANSLLPLFQYPDSVSTVYVSVNSGPISPVRATIGSGGSGGAVSSVNSQTGAVTLTAASIGADTSGAATAAVIAHVAASDPHGDRAAATSALTAHVAASDPHGDRAFATSAVSTHVAASDPHGDRAYADNNKAAGPASSADGQLAVFNGTTGKALKTSAVVVDTNADMTGLRRLTRTLGTDPAVAGLQRTDLNYAVSTSSSDLERVYVSSVLTSWRNEVGFLRGTPHTGYKDDAVVRGVPRSDLTSQTGGWLELQNSARTQVTYKRDWFGKLWRGDGTAAAIGMADVFVTTVGASLPSGLPVGTVVVRI